MLITVGWAWWRHQRAPFLVLPRAPPTLIPPLDVPESFLSSQCHKPFESEWSKIFSSRVKSQELSSHWFASSSQCRVTWNLTFFLWHFLKWRPRCCKMVPEKLENGAQYWFNKFDCRLFISKFSQFEVYLILSLSVISKSLAQPCCKCCNLSVSIVLNVQFTTNGMCVKNHTHVYVVRTSWNRMSTMWDL